MDGTLQVHIPMYGGDGPGDVRFDIIVQTRTALPAAPTAGQTLVVGDWEIELKIARAYWLLDRGEWQVECDEPENPMAVDATFEEQIELVAEYLDDGWELAPDQEGDEAEIARWVEEARLERAHADDRKADVVASMELFAELQASARKGEG